MVIQKSRSATLRDGSFVFLRPVRFPTIACVRDKLGKRGKEKGLGFEKIIFLV